MGWTYCSKGRRETVAQFFAREFPSVEFVGVASNLTTFYAACRTKTAGAWDSDQVWAMVCKIDYKGDRGLSFGYKDMDETMGPNEDECPERILKLLTPLPGDCVMVEQYGHPHCETHGYACSWRKRAWANVEKRKSLPKLFDKAMIKLDAPLTFNSGETRDTFQVSITRTRRGGNRIAFYDPNSYRMYRLGDIKKRGYTILL